MSTWMNETIIVVVVKEEREKMGENGNESKANL
jgi:hypothetical protein